MRAQGCLVYPNVAGTMSVPGTPDRTLVTPWGLMCFIELKDETTRLRSEQREQLRRLELLGAPAWVGRFIEGKMQFENSEGSVLVTPQPWSLVLGAIRGLA